MLDPRNDLCRGCFRTLDEIARWASMSDEERDRVMADLPKRKSNVAKVSVPPLS